MSGKSFPRGCPVGTMVAARYKASPGRPKITVTADFDGSTGRPVGTTVAAGYCAGSSGGGRDGTTVFDLLNVPLKNNYQPLVAHN